MKKNSLLLSAVLVSGLFACSSSSSGGGGGGSGSVSGTFSGHSFTPADTVAAVETQGSAGATVTTATIVIANIGSVCPILQRHGDPPNVGSIQISVGGAGTAVATGAYTVNGNGAAPMVASAFFSQTDAQCNSTLSEVGLSGTVTITQTSASSITGTFDVMFTPEVNGTTMGNADHVTGSFAAPVCNVAPSDGGAAVCGG